MDDPDRYVSGTTVGGKLGCVAGGLIGLMVLTPLMFLNFYGSCPSEAPCHDGEGLRFLQVVLISVSAAAAGGLSVRWIINRLRRPGN